MSRHRRVRNMSYGEDDEYDEYGRSLDDDELVSPSTAEQFMYRRDQHHNPSLSSYFEGERTESEGPNIVPPVSPLATNVVMATPQTRAGSSGEERAAQRCVPQATRTTSTGPIRVTSAATNGQTTKVKVGSKSAAKIGFTAPPLPGETDKPSNHINPSRTPSPSPSSLPPSSLPPSLSHPPFQRSLSKSKYQQIDVVTKYKEREKGVKSRINLVVVGHVDAGKSTLMGHLLYLLGNVTKRLLHKYEVESQKIGKSSFAFAWVLDETGEERSRGVTMDVAQREFETESHQVVLLDAPGHRDFIPHMITGAAQADVAVLVVDATTGEFEAGFDSGGQTREHALLVRSLGVKQLAVAINKMDTVEWSSERFDEIVGKLNQFLKQAGFRESDVTYIPCSGLTGENLVKPSTVAELASWYRGPSLLETIDNFTPPTRPVEKPFRCSVGDIFKAPGSGFNISGRIESGHVQLGESIMVLPAGEVATVKAIVVGDGTETWAVAGDQVIITLQGVEMNNLSIGNVICSVDNPAKVTNRIEARILVFNIEVPITVGFPVVMHYQSVNEPATVRRLVCVLHKSSGELLKRKPRCLTKNSTAVVHLEVSRPVCIELYQDCRDLGRFMLRSGGTTIAAGVVTKVL